MSTLPITTDVVSGSPMSAIPIVIAVNGSKAPKMATLAESIKVKERTKVTLLMVVGIKPNSINDRKESAVSDSLYASCRKWLHKELVATLP